MDLRRHSELELVQQRVAEAVREGKPVMPYKTGKPPSDLLSTTVGSSRPDDGDGDEDNDEDWEGSELTGDDRADDLGDGDGDQSEQEPEGDERPDSPDADGTEEEEDPVSEEDPGQDPSPDVRDDVGPFGGLLGDVDGPSEVEEMLYVCGDIRVLHLVSQVVMHKLCAPNGFRPACPRVLGGKTYRFAALPSGTFYRRCDHPLCFGPPTASEEIMRA